MEYDIAIRAAEDQLRTKLFSFCRSTTPSANPFRFCRSKTTSDLHILRLLKLPWNQSFAGKSYLSLVVPADPQMRGEGDTLHLKRKYCLVSPFLSSVCASPLLTSQLFSVVCANMRGRGHPLLSHRIAHSAPSTSAHPQGRIIRAIRHQ